MVAAASTHSSHHSAHRPTSIVRGIPAEEKPSMQQQQTTTTYTTTEHHTAPVTYTTTTPTELPSYYAATQPVEINQMTQQQLNQHQMNQHQMNQQHQQMVSATNTTTTTTQGVQQPTTTTTEINNKSYQPLMAAANQQMMTTTNQQQQQYHMTSQQPINQTIITTNAPSNLHSTPVVSHDHSSHHMHTAVPSGAASMPRSTSTPYGDSYTQETRKISSVVVESTLLGEMPAQDGVRYVEVPTVEEQTKIVTRKEIREVEKFVPRREIEWVERVVVVPRTEYIDKPVEVEVVQFKEVHKRIPQIVEVPKDVIVEKKVVIPQVVEQTREVPGPTITREVKYNVEKPVEVIRPFNREVPVIVAQTIKPVITESTNQLVVDAFQYEPEIVPVDVHLARPVATALEVVGKVDERHKLVTVSAAQYNTILRALNAGATEKVYSTLPFISEHGNVSFCNEKEATFIVAPEHVRIEGWTPSGGVGHHYHMQTREVQQTETLKSMHSTAAVPAGGRCCGPSDKRTTQTVTTTTTTVNPATNVPVTHTTEVHHVSRGLSVPGTEQRTMVSEDKTMTYDEQRTLETGHGNRSEARMVAAPEGGSIRSHVEVVPSQHGTIPAQRSRVCC